MAYRLSVMPLKRQSRLQVGIELFVGGMGLDEHIAFYKSGSSLLSRTHVKMLAMDTILASARFFSGNLTKVPTMALTVGMGTDCHGAREVMILITGFTRRLLCTRPSRREWTMFCLPTASPHGAYPHMMRMPPWS